MKIRYLLLGLMICVAGAGTINSSDGSFGDQNATPFLIFGHVWYGDGSPCNNPIVNITNACTGAGWCADTVSGCNYYQALLCGSNVGVGDMLEFDVTDVAGLNSTSRVVNQSDLDNGGIFGFNLTLLSMMPRIVGFAPDSPVYDTENATRTFNIMIDQVVDVAWMINGDVVQTNESVTDASYTHAKVAIGVWNVSVRASNANGTDMQEWIWNVTTLLPPNITSFAPKLPVVRDTENMARRFDITIDQVVDVTWLINSSPVRTNASATDASYTHTNVAVGVWNVSARASNANGTAMQEWIWNVTTLPPPKITSFVPPSPVRDTENATRTFGITVDQVVDVTWLINGTEVSDETEVNGSSYTNKSASIGVWNVTAVASNQNGTDIQEWVWHVTPYTPPPSPVFVIYGEVFYEDNTSVDAPCVIVTNLNTSKEFIADNRSGSNFYQIITDASEMRAGDLLLINASKDGVLVGNGSVEHTVTQNESRSGAICVTINRGWADLQVVEISTPPYIFDNVINTINATIANNGTTGSDGFNVSLAVDGSAIGSAHIGSLGVGCAADVAFNWTPHRTGNHTLNVTADADGEIDESDEANNGTSVGVFAGVPDFTVLGVIPDLEYCLIGDTVGIAASVANLGFMDHTAVVEFYDNGSLNITRTDEDWVELGLFTSANDTITLLGALAIRVHFISTNFGSIDIYGKTGSKISSVPTDATDYWTDWVSGDTLIMVETNANFTIDGYQALIANETIHLNAGECRNVTASYRNVTPGDHDISVTIDPHDAVPEYDETNNSFTALPIYVDGIDLEVVNVTLPEELFTDDIVDITATITNNGAVGADSFTVIFEDELGGNVTVFNETTIASLHAGDSINVTVQWDLTGMDTSIGNCTHDMTVRIPLDASPRSRYWPKDDINTENNIWPGYLNIMAKWDFSVEDVTVTPSEAREGGVVDITAIIGNHGHAGGNVSIRFYIDMWDNILGYEVVPLAYFDCLGAERGWSRDDVGNYTGRYIRIGTGDMWVDEGGTNTTSIRWDAFTAAGNHTIMVVADPEERLDEGVNDTDIETSLFGNNMKNCSLSITPPDLSITEFSLPGYADVRDMVNMTAVIRNNEDVQAKSTLWWIVEGDESVYRRHQVVTIDGGHNVLEVPIHPQQGVSMMRVHFAYIYLRAYLADENTGAPGETIIDVLDINDQSLYSDTLIGGNPCTTRNISNNWTKWGSGDTLYIKTDIISDWNGDLYGMVEYKIDKYQVVIGNEMITLAASESYDAIWNATVLPGMYAAGVDVEDQNKSGTIILNGTELALTVSLNETYLDGDLVNITAIITNLGTKNATDFTVSFSDRYNPGHGLCSRSTLGNTTHVPYLAAGASVSVPVPWNASIRNIVCDGKYQMCDGGWRDCDWSNEHIHDYRITVEIDPLNNIEINETNNRKQTDVYVNPSRDFSVTDILFAVNDEPRNPSQLVADELVTLNATISVTNLANRGGRVDVGFYCDDVLLNTTSVVFDTGDGTEYAVFEWLVDVGDNHTITVKVDPVYPRDKIVEFDESNNILHQGVHIIAPDLVVESMALDPEISEVGDVVNITATVANIGQKNASNVTVRFIDECRENASLITNRAISLNISENRSISVDWNTSIAGPHNISVIIDPENAISELDESNNESTKSILVQGADLTVSNLTLTVNGSDVTRTIKHGDVVNITAEIANVGVRDAHNISVGFFIDEDLINKTGIDLSKGGSINISARWDTTPRDYIGNHTVRVFVDCDYAISETNESNNTLIEDVYVCTPELSGNISWDPPNPLDGDELTINATITNSGCVPAEDFAVLMFYDYQGEKVYSKTDPQKLLDPPNENRSYDGAEWVYVQITGTSNINQGDLIVYDRDNTEIASPVEPCWIAVPGDAAMVKGMCDYWKKCVAIRFYAVYPDNLLEVKRLDAGSATNFSLVKKVSSLNHTIAVFIDPENNVPENNETDNAPSDVMYVTPTRDFTVTNVTAAETTNLTDTDTTRITATVANIGFRNGTTNVSFVDREEESSTYNYAFSKTLSPPYVPISPQADRIIHRHGVDAIEVDLAYSIPAKTFGQISVCDGTGKTVWYVKGSEYGDKSDSVIVYVEGDTALIYGSDFLTSLHGYTIHEFNRNEVTLNATETWNESGTLTSIWTASTGDHTLTVAADPDDETGEIDESNNNESILIHVNPSRDPAIVNLTHTPLKPSDGDDVTITAEVRNNGDKTANFTVDFWENTSKKYKTDSQHISVSGASFVDIHLDYRWNRKMMPIGYEWTRINDVWLGGSLGDTIEVRSPRYGELYVCGVRMYSGQAGDYVWHEHVNRVRYMKLLNRTYVTLAPNETRNVTAIWEAMSIKDAPEYSVIVIVDPEDEIDEINEGNNEMERQIVMNYPDLEIGNFESPTESRGARVTIRNTGIGGADDVNVTFEMARREDYSLTGTRGYYTVRPDYEDRHDDDNPPDHIRAHFDYINIPDSGGNLKIAKSISSLRRGDVTETYREDVEDVWSPWVKGDKLVIDSFNARSFEVDEYEWGDVEDETIDHLSSGGSDELEMDMEEWEWEYTYTEPLNLTVRVDPDGEIPEIDEENNNETVIMYADLAAKGIEFASPRVDMLSLDAEKFVIDGYITNGGGDRDDIVYPVSDFNVTLEFRERYPNGTGGAAVFDMTKRVEDPIYGGDDKEYKIRFEFDPEEELEVGGNYSVYLIADSSGDICESNDLYPEDGDEYRLGEYNNITSENVYIYNTSGYTGGGELINVAQGEVNGRVVYTVGDEPSCQSSSRTPPGGEKTVTYTGVVPKGSGNIEFARLFVYWYTWEDEPVLAGMDATFNGHSLTMAGNYSDNPGATNYDVGYGLYSYDVTKYVTKGENKAIVRITSDWSVGIQAIGLLVVYEDEDEPFTKYWVNEGADIMMAENSAFPTGLPDGDCITTAAFDDVKREDTENVNASLLTVLGFYMAYGKPSDDALEFNGKSIGSRIHSDGMSGYWKYHYRKTAIALTNDRWEDVTDELERGDNLVKIRSIGNFMMPNNAFLRLIFPPDLNVINLTAPASTVVGAHHSINVTIRNDGRSDAHDFNATLEIDGRQMVRIPHLDLPAGENMTLHLYNWTPMMLVHVYNLTAAADVLSGEDWTEIETDNNALTKYVPIEEGGFGNQTGPRGTGGGSKPTGGVYTEKITGKIMQGTKEFLSGGGGGGAGMFSALEWIMKGAVWLVLVLFVGLGYRMEQRSYGRASIGLRQPY